jgi:hypothetical protein
MSASIEPVTIVLAGKPFVIRPLTLRQVRDIELLSNVPSESNVEKVARVLDVLLKRDHSAELGEGGVLDMEISRDELSAAATAVQILSGARDRPGEAKAAPSVAADPEKTGDIASAA